MLRVGDGGCRSSMAERYVSSIFFFKLIHFVFQVAAIGIVVFFFSYVFYFQDFNFTGGAVFFSDVKSLMVEFHAVDTMSNKSLEILN